MTTAHLFPVRAPMIRFPGMDAALAKFVQVRPVATTRPAQFRAAQVSPAQLRPSQLRPASSRPSPIRPAQFRAAQVRPVAPRSAPASAVSAPATCGCSAVAQPRLRITRRGRAVVTALVVTPLLVGAGVFASVTGAFASNEPVVAVAAVEYVQVESGQSLWSVAQSVAPQADPREVVSEIVSLNALPGYDIWPGQQLAIPAEYTN